MGIHTAVFNKSYIWATLVEHINCSDEDIVSHCRVNLVFLGLTNYGILHDICRPDPHVSDDLTPKPVQASKSQNKMITCRGSNRGHACKPNGGIGCGKGANKGKRPQTLSESWSQNYGITATGVRTHSLHSNRQPINYLSLNDGLKEEVPQSPKQKRRTTHWPRSAPSANRVAAQKRISSPEAKFTEKPQVNKTDETFSAVPSMSTLTGVPPATNSEQHNGE